MTPELVARAEQAIQDCLDEDEVFSRSYVPAQSTRRTLLAAAKILTDILQNYELELKRGDHR